jgi:hypothetical protein
MREMNTTSLVTIYITEEIFGILITRSYVLDAFKEPVPNIKVQRLYFYDILFKSMLISGKPHILNLFSGTEIDGKVHFKAILYSTC